MQPRSTIAALLCTAIFAVPAATHAAPTFTQTGAWAGGSWTARSTIVGQTSTARLQDGGDPIYSPQRPQKDGVVQLLIDYGPGVGAFVCSGSLASDRVSIITAAHCATDLYGLYKPSITAIFHRGDDTAPVIGNPESINVSIKSRKIAPEYTGYVIDQNDVAVLRLAEKAPEWATAYELWEGNDLTGQQFNVAGYGLRSDVGGAVGTNRSTGILREGWNTYSYRIDDPIWNDELDGIFGEDPSYGYDYDDYRYSVWADFDNGTELNDSECQIAIALALDEGALCDTGIGAYEATIAGGDSGGPGIIDGKLATVNSYGLTFGQDFGDNDGLLNSSWGEFAGYVPLFLHRDWIQAQLPTPGTFAVLGLGLGLITLRARRTLVR